MIANEKRLPAGVVSPASSRREDHTSQNICSSLMRQTVRVCRMIADGSGEEAVPINKWHDSQWDTFLLLPPAMRHAYFTRDNYVIHIADGHEHRCITWTWADEIGDWVTLIATDRYIDIRAAEVVSAAVIY
jgi:hypothetical protein